MAPLPHYDSPGDVRSSPPPDSPASQSLIERVIVWCRRRWWLGLPLALLPVLWLARLLRHAPRPTPSTQTMTHAQAEDAREDIDLRADTEIGAIHGQADAGRDALRDKFGGR